MKTIQTVESRMTKLGPVTLSITTYQDSRKCWRVNEPGSVALFGENESLARQVFNDTEGE